MSGLRPIRWLSERRSRSIRASRLDLTRHSTRARQFNRAGARTRTQADPDRVLTADLCARSGGQRAEANAAESRHRALAVASSTVEHGFRHHRGHASGCKLNPLDGDTAGTRSHDRGRQFPALQAESWGQRLEDGIGRRSDTELRSDHCSTGADAFQATQAPATIVTRLHTSQSHRVCWSKADVPSDAPLISPSSPVVVYAASDLATPPSDARIMPSRSSSETTVE